MMFSNEKLKGYNSRNLETRKCTNQLIRGDVQEMKIQLQENTIPPCASQKNWGCNMSSTKTAIRDPLVSKRPEHILNKNMKKKKC